MSDRQRKWDLRFLDQAYSISLWSKDRSTKTGSVIVRDNRILTTGYNGFPPGCDDEVPERHERPAKYLWTEHAEGNAMFQAARFGISLEGATMYNTFPPCAPCTRGIVMCGIVRVVWAGNGPDVTDPEKMKRWSGDFLVAKQIANEAEHGLIFDIIEENPC